MNKPAHVVRAKPAWLTLYGYYLWAALILSLAEIIRYVPSNGLGRALTTLPQAVFFGFAVYSLWHWKVSWARKFHLGYNGAVVFMGITVMTPVGAFMPYVFYIFLTVISAPLHVLVPDDLLQTESSWLNGVIGVAMLAVAAYWFLCWAKFTPAPDGSAADLASEELSRDVRSIIRKVIIGLFLVGIAAVIKALFGGADGNLVWAAIGGFSLFAGIVLSLVTAEITKRIDQ